MSDPWFRALVRALAVGVVCSWTISAQGEAPLRPVADVNALPPELRSLPMLAVLHQWTPLDRPWTTTVSHATFPVGTHRLVEGDQRVLALDPKTGRIAPAQVSVVAWNGAGSPEVVEVIFADELARGSNVRCLFLKPGDSTPPAPDAEPWTLVTDADGLAVRMTDGLGARYWGSLFEKKVASHKSGPLEYVEEFFGKLYPEGPAKDSIPQPFRFHTFVTARKGEPAFDVRVLVENCPSEQPAAEFPFAALEFGVKGREIVWEESLLPAARPVSEETGRKWFAAIPPNPDGKLHVAPDHYLLRLRFALAAPTQKDRAAVRMHHEPLYAAVPGLDPTGKPTNSWHSIPAFGPTRVGIPRAEGPHAAIRNRVDRAAQEWPASPLLKQSGPWWVHGEVGGEAPSGVEIAFTCPWAARFVQSGGAPSPWRVINAAFDANLVRQRFGFWRPDGTLWTLEDVLETKEGVVCTPWLNIHSGQPHPTPYCRKFGRPERGAEPGFKALKRVIDDPARTAAYVKELARYTNYDDEHLCRFTQYLFPLVWFGNDPCARLLLEAQASMSLAGSNPFPTGPGREDQKNGSLAELHRIAAEAPGRGSPHLARGLGWNAQAVVGGLAVTRNPALRGLGRRWLTDFARLPGICQLPTGGVHRTDSGLTATFDLNGDGRISRNEREMPVEHASVYMQGIYRLAGCRSVLMQLDPSRQHAETQQLEQAARRLDRYFIDFAWDDTVNMPGWTAVVAVKANPNEIIAQKRPGTVWGGGPDAAFYFNDILAEAYRFSGDGRFLEKLAAMHSGSLEVERDAGNSIHAAWVLESAPSRRPKKRQPR